MPEKALTNSSPHYRDSWTFAFELIRKRLVEGAVGYQDHKEYKRLLIEKGREIADARKTVQ